jgi:hypothetical protein
MAEGQNAKILKGYCQEASKLHPTNCSGAVKYVARMMGYPLPDLQANQLIDHIKKAGWEEVDERRAQNFADSNRLVIAGKKDVPNGHVVVVLPGGMARSGGYSHVDKKDHKTKKAAYHGDYPRSCSTALSGWPGAMSEGDKSVRDAWSERDYKSVQYWVAPLYGPV